MLPLPCLSGQFCAVQLTIAGGGNGEYAGYVSEAEVGRGCITSHKVIVDSFTGLLGT